MTDTDVRDALHRATRHLDPHPGLLDDVRRGGHARLVRRRSMLTAGLAAVGVTATAGALRLPSHRGTDESADAVFDRPTGGDLAGDQEHLRRVLDAWYAYVPVDPAGQDGHGDAHITWIGATPAGPAAFVAQRQRSHTTGELVIGLATATDGAYTVVDQGVWSPRQGVTFSHAYLIGAARDVLLLRDGGTPVRYSTALRYGTDGKVVRAFRPVPFRDGAAVLAVPPQREKPTIALLTGPADDPQPVYIVGREVTGRYGRPVTGVFSHQGSLPGASTAWPADENEASDAAERQWADPVLAPYLDPGAEPPYSSSPNLHLRGATPDGRRLLVRTEAVADGQARVLLVWGRPDAVPVVRCLGVRDVSGPLELALRLPDRQGVVAAMPNGTLRYRIGSGRWSTVVENWTLLPDIATEVEVVPHGGVATRVSVR